MHPKMKELVKKLDLVWDECLQKAQRESYTKMSVRKPHYEQVSPVWMRLTKVEHYSTMIMLKAERVRSELATCEGDLSKFDPDNAIDLIVYTLFLIAYSYFVRREGNNERTTKEET